MPRSLHDAATRDDLRARLSRLSPDSPRAWGKMTADQMLWHCNMLLESALGRGEHAPMRVPLPNFLLKFIILNLPWPKGSPTHPDYVAGDRYDFEAERTRCVTLIDEFAGRPLEATTWGRSPGFGEATGAEWSRLQARHLDHHLRQFST
jgi:hypothetical protein